ncbi:MAG: hypothetical protein H6Q25_1097 [Bacteroidetes bacterium]|nr:hypothetical protein [Bacteroidota bacterium]
MTTKYNKLDQDVIIPADNLFEQISYDSNIDSWVFRFNNNVFLLVSTLWRLLKDDLIVMVSADHGQQFGLLKPVDIVSELSQKLTGQKLMSLKIKKNTADLILTLTDRFEIEILISSGGYESYNLHANNKQYIGMGMGNVAILYDGQ